MCYGSEPVQTVAQKRTEIRSDLKVQLSEAKARIKAHAKELTEFTKVKTHLEKQLARV